MNKNVVKIKDIAKLANVSTGTVDRVLHKREDVSERTREKVLKIINELGYKTNIIAKTLASKKQIVFATLIPQHDRLSNYWKRPLIGIKKAEKEYSRYGVRIKNYFFNINDKYSFKKQADLILKESVQGIVIAPVFQKEALYFIDRLKNKSIPYIFLDSELKQDKNTIGYVGQDSFQSGKVAAKLIDNRINNLDIILLINLSTNPENQNHLNQRTDGFRSYFAKKNRVGAFVEMDITNLDKSFIKKKLSHVFKNISQIKAIFVTSSKVNLIAKYLYDHQLHDQVILVGHDLIDKNLKYLDNGTIDYLISQNPIEQGYRSIVKLFESVILKHDIEEKTYLPINIVIKENVMYS